MTLSNRDVVERFVRGETTGIANSMRIKEIPDGSTALVGYGWAVYGRRKPNGRVVMYDGWRDYSQTSMRHTSILKEYADVVKDKKPSWETMVSQVSYERKRKSVDEVV